MSFLRDNVLWLPAFLFVLVVVVFFHELGHFVAARWAGVKVKAFSLGFGREIFGFNDRHGTRWRLAWIPLGGYVKFMDDENGASMPSREAISQMTPEERENSFHLKPLWKRVIIVAAGPVANFILAIVIWAGLIMIYGERVAPPVVNKIIAGSSAEAAGFRIGDKVLEIDGKEVESFADVQLAIALNQDEHPMSFLVERNGDRRTLTAKPKRVEDKDANNNRRVLGELGLRRVSPATINTVTPGGPADKAGLRRGDIVVAIDEKPIDEFDDLYRVVNASPDKTLTLTIRRNGEQKTLKATPRAEPDAEKSGKFVGRLQISRADDPEAVLRSHNILTALRHGVSQTWFVTSVTADYLRKVVTGREKADQLSGPVGIARVSGQMAREGFVFLVNLTAVLSVGIGLFNLFPIPILDGGHLLFYAIEAVRQRPLSERAQEIGFRIGLAFVLMLMVFVTWNDLARLLGKS